MMFISLSFQTLAQTGQKSSLVVKSETTAKDTLKKKYKYPSPKLAAGLSAVVPGLGQAYNKSYWKIPVVYAGMAGIGALAYNSHQNYRLYKELYIQRIDTVKNNESFLSLYSTDQLFQLQEQNHRRRDLMIIVGALFYVANIVDAAVDAHMYHFDVGPDLSLNVSPYFSPDRVKRSYNAGLTLSLNF